jgi:hypothetical protein
MSLNGSFGLIIDLGLTPAPEKLLEVYKTLWQPTLLRGPSETFSEFGPIPRGAQGHLHLPSGQESACYTRFERDNLGYPEAGHQAPVLFSLGISGLKPDLPENSEAQAVLLAILNTIANILPVHLAVMGHSNLYHVNAALISPEWIDLNQELLLSIWLSLKHPWAQQLKTPQDTRWVNLNRDSWASFLTEQSEAEKYLAYKAAINQSTTEPKIQLEWEKH